MIRLDIDNITAVLVMTAVLKLSNEPGAPDEVREMLLAVFTSIHEQLDGNE